MIFISLIFFITCCYLLIYFLFRNLKKLLIDLFEGRIRRLEMEVDEIELKLTK